jgi:hypothetical protein
MNHRMGGDKLIGATTARVGADGQHRTGQVTILDQREDVGRGDGVSVNLEPHTFHGKENELIR